LVGDCVAAMKARVKIPVTVKCRIGVDEQEPREALFAFVEQVKAAAVDAVVVHARKAWLEGLSPKENRDIPPLDYPIVVDLKRAHPDLPIAVNGGIHDLSATMALLRDVDGVMMGRAAYQSPELLIDADPILFGASAPVADAVEAIEAYVPYVERELARGGRLHDMTRHLLGLFAGQPGARAYRRHLATFAPRRGAGLDVLREAVRQIGKADRNESDSTERASTLVS
jgi:tRNA-dihydrouridine synthase A